MGKPWFRVKRYGYGAGLPCSWEGWAVLAGFFLIVFGGLALRLPPAGYLTTVLAAVAVFGVICWRKSDGPWKWRNGLDE